MKKPAKTLQAGFTLIELMVVLVIIAIVTSVTVLSLGSNDKTRINSQANQFKSYLSLVRDQSAFNRRLYLLVPSETGLAPYVFRQGKWLSAEKISALSWKEGLVVEWSVDRLFAQKQQLPKAGWMFWPSGEVLAGEVTFRPVGQNQLAKQLDQVLIKTVTWNGLLQFKSDSVEASSE